jgi:hypothetical protein
LVGWLLASFIRSLLTGTGRLIIKATFNILDFFKLHKW